MAQDRQVVTALIKQYLSRAKTHMKQQADKHRSERVFSVGDLVQAENTLTSGINPNSEDRRKADFIVSNLVDRRLYGKPWQGPLPTPLVSPPRTLGDVLVKATCQREKKIIEVQHRRGWLLRRRRAGVPVVTGGPWQSQFEIQIFSY